MCCDSGLLVTAGGRSVAGLISKESRFVFVDSEHDIMLFPGSQIVDDSLDIVVTLCSVLVNALCILASLSTLSSVTSTPCRKNCVSCACSEQFVHACFTEAWISDSLSSDDALVDGRHELAELWVRRLDVDFNLEL